MDTHRRTLFSCSLILYLSGLVTTFDAPRLIFCWLVSQSALSGCVCFVLCVLCVLSFECHARDIQRLLNLTEPGSIHARTLGLDNDVTAADRAVWQRMLDGLAKFPEQQSPYGTIFAVRPRPRASTSTLPPPLTPLSLTSHYGTTLPFPSHARY